MKNNYNFQSGLCLMEGMRLKMKIINIDNQLYPKKLREIFNAPKKIYVIGDEEILNSNCISVVGSRNNTEYGKKWCKKFVNELVKYDLKIVSGMAVGIDTIAHKQAIKCGGKTIAILPSGLKNIYPKENKDLYDEIILNGGCIASEYFPKKEADSKSFLERNRIVSGLSIATLVVEAAYRSGTSVTAKMAYSQNRDVFCIPGSLDNPKSIGTNKLIKNFAKIATCPEDIINNYKFLHKIELNVNPLIENEGIYNLITEKPININDIAKKSKKNLKEIMSELTILELEGKIKKLPGNMYIRGE